MGGSASAVVPNAGVADWGEEAGPPKSVDAEVDAASLLLKMVRIWTCTVSKVFSRARATNLENLAPVD